MSDNVVPFGERCDRALVCDCGCVTWRVLDTGEARCGSCGAMGNVGAVGWLELVEEDKSADAEGTFRSVELATTDMARERVLRQCQLPDVAVLVAIFPSGELHAWADLGDGEHTEWVRERITAAVDLAAPLRRQST